MKDVYVILGAPGSGKLTQAQLLAKKFKLDFISWGQTVYEEKLHKKLPHCFEKSMETEVRCEKSTQIFFKTIESKIIAYKKKNNKKGLVICGYPRKLSEAKNLLLILERNGLKVKCLINLNLSLETIVKRAENNYFCEKCGKVYNELLVPKHKGECDKDNSKLTKIEVKPAELKEEFTQFLKENKKTYEYLRGRAEYYFNVSGDENELDIFSNIVMKLKNETRECFTVFKRQSSAILPTEFGSFQIITYLSIVDFTYHIALVKGDVKNKFGVLTRVHSSCITGDIFSSLKCDCGPQLHRAMQLVQKEDCGLIIYLFQEGRGINIINKINAYAMQQKGLDTVEANEILGLPAEMRQYGAVKDILEDLNVKSIRLLTNNPDKISKLTDLGVAIEKTEPLEIKANDFSKRYLSTKKYKMKHRLHIV